MDCTRDGKLWLCQWRKLGFAKSKLRAEEITFREERDFTARELLV